MTLPHPAPFRRLISMYDEPISIRRRDDTTDTTYGNPDTYTSVSPDRYMYIGRPEEFETPTTAGEFQSADFIGFSVPSEDIEVNDRFDHGSVELEVTSKVGIPNDSDPVVYRYSLDRP